MWGGNVAESPLSRLSHSKDSDAESQPDVEASGELGSHSSGSLSRSRSAEEASGLLARGPKSDEHLPDR